MFSSSPRLIAAYRVFLRLPTPRHPPDALVNLFCSKKTSFLPYSIVNEPTPSGPPSSCLGHISESPRISFQAWLPVFVVGLDRLELSTSRLSGVRSNHLSYRPSSGFSLALVELDGFEPTTPGLQSRCSPS